MELKDVSLNLKKIDQYSETSSETCENISNDRYCKICDPKCKYLDCICEESWKNFDEI